MRDHELAAWLGSIAGEVSDEQRQSVLTAARRIDERWPEPDLADLRETALNAAVQVLLGDDTLEAVAGRWTTLRARERETHAAASGAIIAAAVLGASESSITARTGITRVTVRKALGKG